MAVPPMPTGFEYLARRAQRRQSLADSMLEQATSPGQGQQTALSPFLKIAQAFLANKVQKQADTAEQEYGQETRGLQAYELDRAQKFFQENPTASETDAASVLGNSTSPIVQALLKQRMEEASKRRIAAGEYKGLEDLRGPDGQVVTNRVMADGSMAPLPGGMRRADKFVNANDVAVDPITGEPLRQLPQAPDAVAIRGEPAPGQVVGPIIPNAPAIGAKTAVAAAGRPVTNNRFDVQTQGTLGRLLPTSQIKMLDDGQVAATQFIGALPQFDRAEALLKDGKLFTGFASGARLDAARFADLVGLGGATNAEKVANTQSYVRETGQRLLPILAALRPASDTDVKIAQRMAAADPSLSLDELKRAVTAGRTDGLRQVEAYNKKVEQAIKIYGRQVPEAAAALEMYRVPVPEGYGKPKPAISGKRKALLSRYGVEG